MSRFYLVEDSSGWPSEEKLVQETLNDRFCCVICHALMEEPVSVTPCGHTFDGACVEQWRRARGTSVAACPKCKERIQGVAKAPDMRQLIRETVRTHCINEGCDATMVIDALSAHLKSDCQYARFHCTLLGSDGQPCGAVLGRSEMEAHDAVCLNVPVKCKHAGCNKRPLRVSLKDHMASCALKPGYILRDVSTHKQTCPIEPVPCPICSEAVPRSQMDAHMSDPGKMVVHIGRLAQRVTYLDRENCALKKANEEMSRELRGLRQAGAVMKQQLQAFDGMAPKVQTLERELKALENEGQQLKARVRPAISSSPPPQLGRGAEGMIEGSDAVEMRWQADLEFAGRQGGLVRSPYFACGGWMFYIRLRRTMGKDNTWGAYVARGRTAARSDLLHHSMKLVGLKAACEMEIPEVGFSRALTPDGDWKTYGWPDVAKLEKTKKTLLVILRVNRVEAHYKRTG